MPHGEYSMKLIGVSCRPPVSEAAMWFTMPTRPYRNMIDTVIRNDGNDRNTSMKRDTAFAPRGTARTR